MTSEALKYHKNFIKFINLKVYFVFPIFPAIEPIQEFNSIIICNSILRAFKLPLPQYLKVLTHSLQNHSHYDIITCYSDSLLKLLESVISKLSIQIIWTSDSFSVFTIFKKDKSYKRYLLVKKSIHISDQRNHFLSKCSDSLPYVTGINFLWKSVDRRLVIIDLRQQ